MSKPITDRWMPLLTSLNARIFGGEWITPLPPEALSNNWCGSAPASESDILETEKRLGITLPPSYRSFLAVSNGWQPFNHFIERLLPVQAINWIRLADPARVEAMLRYPTDDVTDEEYMTYDGDKSEALRPWYFPDCLLIGTAWSSEDDIILLNPKVTFPDGEWEAIFFANWIPGNERYRSFYDLVLFEMEDSD